MSSAPRRERSSGTHVGVLSSGGTLTPDQHAALSRALAKIRLNNPGRVTLHHGCGQGADETAHRFARKSSDWLIYGHPASRPAADPGHTQSGMLRGLNRQAAGRPRDQRDADIVDASHIVVVVLPYHQPGTWKKLAAASAAGLKVIHIPRSQAQPAAGTAIPAPRTAPAPPARPARKRFRFPDDWYEAAVCALGMRAEIQDNGTAFDIVLTSGGLVSARLPYSGARDAAVNAVAGFNRTVAKRKLNPSLADIHR